MKDFSRKSYRFATISLGQKLVYSSFLFFTLLGWTTILIFYCHRSGFSAAHLTNYYLGNEPKMMYPKSFLELWEITHFHLFTMPVLFLILIHLFMLTRTSNFWKLFLFLVGFFGLLFDMGSPWLIVYAHPAFVWLKISGRILLHMCFLSLMIYPLLEMWGNPKRLRLIWLKKTRPLTRELKRAHKQRNQRRHDINREMP